MKEYRRAVMYYETDRMGFVHHSNYIRYFEEGRLDHMKQMGFPYKQLEDMKIIVPVVDVYAKYRIPLLYGDEFVVKTKVTAYDGIRLKYSYEIENVETGKLVADGYSSHCFLDDETRRPVSLKRKLPEIHELFLTFVEEE